MIDLDLHFTAELWVSVGPGAWYFITLPTNISEEIRFFREKHTGFGTIRVDVRIGETRWKTSLFPDKASSSFLLPIKSEIRKKEKLAIGDSILIELIVNV